MVNISDEYWERIKQHFPEEDIPESRTGRIKQFPFLELFPINYLNRKLSR